MFIESEQYATPLAASVEISIFIKQLCKEKRLKRANMQANITISEWGEHKESVSTAKRLQAMEPKVKMGGQIRTATQETTIIISASHSDQA